MYPILRSGDFVLVNRLAYLYSAPKIGDIVAARDPRDGKIIIKRVIKIENTKYHVEGDNRTASTDSRDFGLIDKNNIIGKVIFVL
ncbi:nickel-type superoxide dismutase maturation protease [Patescibacteria group bacterium]|nr:nickel-type superoxide dismutase maturation protease [Patescibacteria group bacterium]MBU4099506.1 nickel-type superoxide dismutase maturation protease [Patescibacteria group bacterium]